MTSSHESRSRIANGAGRSSLTSHSKFLVVHADDLGLSHSVNQASFRALQEGSVTSASVLVVAPWVYEVADYASAHPHTDLGVHLAITSEWKGLRWGPVVDKHRVKSLIDADGYFWRDENLVARHADVAEVELEIQAQFDLALQIGIRPTHLDMHMFALAARPDLYAALAKLAQQNGVPCIAWRGMPLISPSLLQGLLLDSLIVADGSVRLDALDDFYTNRLKDITNGISQMIVHLGYDDAELRAITDACPGFGSAWRKRDFDFVTSSEFRQLIQANGINLVGWRDLKELSDPN
jgi:chitin disaccharide deacetylase